MQINKDFFCFVVVFCCKENVQLSAYGIFAWGFVRSWAAQWALKTVIVIAKLRLKLSLRRESVIKWKVGKWSSRINSLQMHRGEGDKKTYAWQVFSMDFHFTLRITSALEQFKAFHVLHSYVFKYQVRLRVPTASESKTRQWFAFRRLLFWKSYNFARLVFRVACDYRDNRLAVVWKYLLTRTR